MWQTARRVTQGAAVLGVVAAGTSFAMAEAKRREKAAKDKTEPRVAVVKMYGVIAPSMGAQGIGANQTINMDRLGPALTAAFKPDNVKAVMLRMNSPGGSPVQSSLLYKHVLRLREQYPDKPCMCFVEDVCASGGYFIASACDQIFCDESSIVGSVGVIRADFKLKGLADKLGVERRVITAGQCKSQMDPFLEEQPRDRVMVKAMMEKLHGNFIEVVKSGRGNRLKPEAAAELHRALLAPLRAAPEEEDEGEKVAREGEEEDYEGMGLFDGSVYTGPDAIAVGFADGLDTLEAYVAREYGDDIKLMSIKEDKKTIWDFLSSLGVRHSSVVLQELAGGKEEATLVRSAAELAMEHDLWGKYGLSPPRS